MEDLILHFDETLANIITFIDANLKIDLSSLQLHDTPYLTNTQKVTDRYEREFTANNYHHFNEVFSNVNFNKYNYRIRGGGRTRDH